MFVRTLNIHEDGWGNIAIVPKEDPEALLKTKGIAFSALQSLTNGLFLAANRVTCPLSYYIPTFQREAFALIQDTDEGCAFYGFQEYGILRTLCLTRTHRTVTEDNMWYVDVLDGFEPLPNPEAVEAITQILVQLGTQHQVALLDSWHGPAKVINLQEPEAVQRYLNNCE